MGQVRGFYEYRILPEKREDYLKTIAAIRQKKQEHGYADYRICESLEGNRFVETFLMSSMEEYHRMEAKLLEDEQAVSYYHDLDVCINGGRSSQKIWFFRELNL